jgi:transposase-like protein
MTFLSAQGEVFKQDSRGRVRVPRERREALLEEFERSGASGAKFARLVGIKYQTFASWVQQRRKARAALSTTECAPGAGRSAVRLFEAVMESAERTGQAAVGSQGLCVELPGGSRMLVESPVQLPMAAELVALIAQAARTRC